MAQVSPPSGRREVSEDAWTQARTTLVFYFSHHGGASPEDLAQETLKRLVAWLNAGNQIDGDSGFLKLCFGFARNVLREARDSRIRPTESLEFDLAAPVNKTMGLNSNDSAVFVKEMLSLLSPPDRELVLAAELMSPLQLAERFSDSVGNINVRVFRARERLRKLANSHIGRTVKP